ncbi:MAG: hypothetical protein ACI845_002610 [Gammaproteobacteria bacterium]|jgi:hypothetical protein
MAEVINQQQRASFADIANIVFPGGCNQPPSSGLDLEHAPLDRVLRARNELLIPLVHILDQYESEPDAFLSHLEDREFNLLMTIISASYLGVQQVKDSLEYPGQQALTLSRAGFGAEELVFELMQKPKRYRDL